MLFDVGTVDNDGCALERECSLVELEIDAEVLLGWGSKLALSKQEQSRPLSWREPYPGVGVGACLCFYL